MIQMFSDWGLCVSKFSHIQERTLRHTPKVCGAKSRLQYPGGQRLKSTLSPWVCKSRLERGDFTRAAGALFPTGFQDGAWLPVQPWSDQNVAQCIACSEVVFGQCFALTAEAESPCHCRPYQARLPYTHWLRVNGAIIKGGGLHALVQTAVILRMFSCNFESLMRSAENSLLDLVRRGLAKC